MDLSQLYDPALDELVPEAANDRTDAWLARILESADS